MMCWLVWQWHHHRLQTVEMACARPACHMQWESWLCLVMHWKTKGHNCSILEPGPFACFLSHSWRKRVGCKARHPSFLFLVFPLLSWLVSAKYTLFPTAAPHSRSSLLFSKSIACGAVLTACNQPKGPAPTPTQPWFDPSERTLLVTSVALEKS